MALARRNPVAKAIYFGAKRIYALTGTVPPKNRTELRVDGRPVVVIHNPKAAGSTLKAMLGVRGTTHTMPRLAYSRRMWRGTFSVVAVRHPFDRFVSGYTFMVRDGRGIMRRHPRDEVAAMTPLDFLDFIRDYPEKLGPQVNWACHPDPDKPMADLVLRVEESGDWHRRLAAAGIPARPLPERRNTSRAEGEDYARSLCLDSAALDRLEALVFAEYGVDYATFGYERRPPGW